jgi:glycosyltransferase involved in cell wall biosynthesis
MHKNYKNHLLISYLDYPYPAGLSYRIDGISNVLSSKGIKIKILAPLARSNNFTDNNLNYNIDIQYIDLRKFRSCNPEKKTSKFILWLLFSFFATIKVISYYIKNRCLIQYQSLYSSIPALMAKILTGATIIGDDIVLLPSFFNVLVLKLTDIVITASSIAFSLANSLGKKVIYLPNGVKKKICEKSSSKFRSNLIFVGSLSFQQNLKAVEKIIKIASFLENKEIRYKIIIVGGPLSYAKHLLNKKIVRKGKIKFLGAVSNERLDELYSSSSIGLLPFFKDAPLTGGQRTKTLEYFANKLLVITGEEGIKGINGLKNGEHYILANSLDEMMELIQEIINEKSFRNYEQISCNGKKFICNNYSWENITKEYISTLRTLILSRN